MLPHLLFRRLGGWEGEEEVLKLVIRWSKLQLLLSGERQPAGWVGSEEQAAAVRHACQRFLAVLQEVAQLVGAPDHLLQSIKLHSLLEHALLDIEYHGHPNNYNAQHWEMWHKQTKADIRATNMQLASFLQQLAMRAQVGYGSAAFNNAAP